MKPFWNKKLSGISIILIVCTVFIYFITGFLFFPQEIRMTENTTHRFRFGLPMEAVIEPETVSVLQVNNQPVDSNIKVSLNDTVTIASEETGTAQMTLNVFGLPVKKVTLDIMPDMEIIPCGLSIGVSINTDGVLVLGTDSVKGADGDSHKPCDGKLKSGDIILHANGEALQDKESLIQIIEKSDDEVKLKVKRDEEMIETLVKPVKSVEDKQNKIGVWVRDSTQGIGTVTYYNPESQAFAALGHGILDVDTKKLMSVKNGKIMASSINSIKKGGKGTPGELVGEIQPKTVLGEVKSNSPFGIYGIMDPAGTSVFTYEKMKIGLQDQVHEGPAVIRSNVDKASIEEYDVFIESVNRYSSDDTKGMVLRITDPDLLQKTGGIVQGMSGSPIIQDGRVIGAVTHVFVQDPTKGYGIFIENMLKQEKNMSH